MRPPSLAAAYLHLVPILSEVARDHGYALAVHGTLARDLDVVAVAWTEAACTAEELVAAIHGAVMYRSLQVPLGPEAKPHGRLAWSIPLDGGAFIDLSVVPPTVAP